MRIDSGEGGTAEPSTRGRVAWPVVVAASLAVIAVVVWPAPDGDDRHVDQSAPASPMTAATRLAGAVQSPDAADSPSPIESELPWPEPPADHEPHVLTRPGEGPIVAKPDGLRLLYVNSIGRVTLLDLATGDRTEVEMADERIHDTIALEADGFRSLRRRMNVELAGPGAVVVHLHRPTLLTGWSADSEAGLHLCLTTDCLASGRLDRLVVEVEPWPAPSVTLEPLRSAGRPDIVELLAGDGVVTGRFRIVETPDGTARLPEPLGGAVWLVRTTDAGAASSDV
jgi:hypothetical protein